MNVAVCRQCGAPLPGGARYCPNCGTAVASGTTDERKVVTVLFADLADSTVLATTLDPERYREVMSAFYAAVSEELASLRGRAEKFIGDAVMATWGVPQAEEDDALRAVRAGVMIRDRVGRLADELIMDRPLHVRVGVNSGAVAIGTGPRDQFFATGAAVNVAARLQQLAAPDEVLVGATTRRLTENHVAYGEPRVVTLRGLREPVSASPVVSLSMQSTRRTIPLVGRRREVTELVEAAERTRSTARSMVVTLIGEAGIGKSRLLDELVAQLPEDTVVLKGHATEFAEDVTFAPLAEMIRRLLGVGEETPADEVRTRLEQLVAGCCDETDQERVSARLGLALGLGGPPDHDDRDSDEDHVEGEGEGGARRYRAAELRAALVSIVEGLTGGGPVVMILDDLHQARPEFLDLVERFIDETVDLRLLVVASGRPELLARPPAWLDAGPIIRVQPLSGREAADLARAAGSVDETTAERIAQHAGGNPFFVIETTGMLLERTDAGTAATEHDLPASVQAVVAARLDHLDPAARELARRASVFARATFHVRDLRLIAEPTDESLAALEEAEILLRERDRTDVWRFRHELLRDVAYESLPKRERLRLHLLLADGIEHLQPDRFPQSVAYHLYRAAIAARDLTPDDGVVTARAIKALSHVGDQSRWRLESRTAIEAYQRALALVGPPEAWGPSEAKLLSFIGEAHYWLGEYAQARDRLNQAMALKPGSLLVRSHAARFLGDIALNVDGDHAHATEHFEEALAAANELDEPFTRARVHLMAGWGPYWIDDLEGARSLFAKALEITRANPDPDPWAEARALVSLASVEVPGGHVDDALAMAREALRIGRDSDDLFTIAVAQESIGNLLRRKLALPDALVAVDEAVRIFRDLDARWELASALGDRGEVHRLAARPDLAEEDLREALTLCRALHERQLVGWTITTLAWLALERGDLETARRLATEAAAEVPEGDVGAEASNLEIELGLALVEGDAGRAREAGRRLLAQAGTGHRRAATTWWVGSLLGSEAAGGAAAVEAARARLEAAGWRQQLAAPDRLAAFIPTPAGQAGEER